MKSTAIKLLQALLLVLTVPGADLQAQSEAVEFTPEEQAWINANPIIKVGGETDWAPFDFADAEGRHTGIVADYLDLVSARSGLQFEVRLDSFTNLMSAMASGDIDLLPAIYFSEERARRHTLTSKYHQVRNYVFARDDVDVDRSLSGKTVAMVKGFSPLIATLKETYPDVIVLELDSVDETIDAVVTRRADYLFDALGALNYRLNQSTVTNIHPVFAIPGSEPIALYMASRKDTPELASIISKVLDSMGEAERQAIVLRWVGMVPAESTPAGPALNLTSEEIAWIAEHPTIRVHNEMDWPPFNFNENGQPIGFSIDHMNLVASMVGLDVEYISGPSWQEFLDMLRARDLDVIANAIPTEERREYMFFTSTFYEQPVAVVVEESTTGINSLDDLSGRRVAVVRGFSQQQFMEDNYPDAELILQEDLLDCLYSVLEGSSDAMIASLPPTKYLIDKQSLAGLRVAVISRDPQLMARGALAVRKDWPVLRDILQKGMDALDEKEVTALRHKWFGLESVQASGAARLELTTEEQAWVSEHPTIRVHNEMNWPPFNFNENGQPRGFSIDLIDLVAEQAGLNVEYISGPNWDEFKEMLQSGGLDVLLNIDTSPPEPDYAIFTTNYATMATAVFVRDKDIQLESLDDLESLRIAVTRGFSTQRYLEREYPQAELLLVDTLLEAVFAVMDGRADVVVDDYPAINYIIQHNSLTGLRVAMMSMDPELVANVAFGVRKDWPILRDILQKALDGLDPETVNDLRTQWLGQQSRQSDDQVGLSKTIYWLVGITLGVFLLLVILNRISSHFSKGEGVGLQTGTPQFRILMLGSLSVFVALVGILGWVALNHIKEKILQDVANNLENVLLTTGQRLDLWVNQQADVLDQIVKNANLIQQIELLLTVPADAEDLLSSANLSAVRATLKQYEDALGLGFFIINQDGISIASRRDNNIGTNNLIAIHQPERLQRVFLGEAVFIPPMRSDVAIKNENQAISTSLFIAVPVRNDGGKVIAALTMRLDPKQGFSRVLQFSRVGESGESYAFDRNGTLLSASRFEDDLREIGLLDSGQSSVMNIQIRDPGGNMTEGFRSEIPRTEQPLTHMVDSVLSNIGAPGPGSGVEGVRLATARLGMDGYRDYRGVPVFGAWLWDEHQEIGLTSEIDVSEALATFTTIRSLSLAVLGMTLVLSLGGVLFILSTGERTNRALRNAKDELEDRVEERTRDLNTAKEWFSSLVENIPGAVYRFKLDGTYTTVYYSEYYLQLTGYPASDFLAGKVNFRELIHPDDIDRLDKNLGSAITANKPFQHEFRITDKAGKLHWLNSMGTPVFDDEGNPEFADGTMFDITEQKQADVELAEAREAADEALGELENVSSVILRWAPDTTITSMNTYGLNLFGFSEEELIGKPLLGTIVRDIEQARKGVKEVVDNVVEHPERFRSGEGQNCKSDGEMLWMAWSNNSILNEDGSLKEILAIGHDITQRKMLEAELEEAMNVANEATKAKGDFLANMSHEIRTPMNAIMGLSDLCLRTELNAKQQDYMGKIYASAESLLGIINDILDFSKIEAGKLDMESVPFEIDRVLDNLATVVTVKTQEKGLELLFSRDSEVPTVLVGDAMRLGQVLVNLVNNAVKFTESGEIVVRIEVMQMQEDHVALQFSVRDTGIGMNEEQQGRMFKSFSQADTSTTRKYGGTGLGLAISKQLVELMGGEIRVESEPDVGSTFIFTAKLGVGDASEQRVLVPVNKELRAIHALVVDDNDSSREILTAYLESFTFKVTAAENAEEAIEILETGQDAPELILMDWLMPGMNGLEAAEKIKQELKLEKDPHIILVSAFATSSLAGKPRVEFVDNMLGKPVSPSHLFDAVMEAFGEAVSGFGKEHMSARQAEMEALRPIQGASLLVVEDNEINQQVARELLEHALFRVEVASQGKEAIDMLNKAKFDCVLMDCQMPVMDGFDATREIRKDVRFKTLPILAMTANATLEDQKRCKDAGMNDHIAKPIIPMVLFETLLKWVEQKEYEIPDAPDEGDGITVELPVLPGVDTEAGVARVGGNIKSYLKLLSKFAENQAEAISEIRLAFADNDNELSVRLAHTLKGVGGAIGATALQEASANLETKLKDGPKALPKKLLSAAEKELDHILSLLGDLFAADDESGGAATDSLPEDLPEKLNALLDKLEEYDSEAEDLVFELLDQVKGTEIYDSLVALKKRVGQYDFETAVDELKPLIEKYS